MVEEEGIYTIVVTSEAAMLTAHLVDSYRADIGEDYIMPALDIREVVLCRMAISVVHA